MWQEIKYIKYSNICCIVSSQILISQHNSTHWTESYFENILQHRSRLKKLPWWFLHKIKTYDVINSKSLELQNNIWQVTPLDLRHCRVYQFIKLTFLEQPEALPRPLTSSTTTECRMVTSKKEQIKKQAHKPCYLMEPCASDISNKMQNSQSSHVDSFYLIL
jgi:hypothetical protein